MSEVLSRLRGANLVANPAKCVWTVQKVEFLGYIIEDAGISMSDDKVTAVMRWPMPTCKRDIQVFLGFGNFYRHFIFNYSKISVPLTSLLADSVRFEWSEQQEQAFQLLKEAFTSAPILVHFDHIHQTCVEMDASDWAVAGILSQKCDDGRLHPVAFYSRKLQNAEVNYEIYDKEMLAIVDCFGEWGHLLEGTSCLVVVYTDHKNLEFFATTKKLNWRQARWAEKLSPFDFTIVYHPGSKNGKADALSHHGDHALEEGGIP